MAVLSICDMSVHCAPLLPLCSPSTLPTPHAVPPSTIVRVPDSHIPIWIAPSLWIARGEIISLLSYNLLTCNDSGSLGAAFVGVIVATT